MDCDWVSGGDLAGAGRHERGAVGACRAGKGVRIELQENTYGMAAGNGGLVRITLPRIMKSGAVSSHRSIYNSSIPAYHLLTSCVLLLLLLEIGCPSTTPDRLS